MSYPPIKNGTRVKATVRCSSEDEQRNYMPSAIVERARHNGQTGVVFGYYDSYGLCYDVRFEDGTVFFNPNELEILA